MVLSCVVVVIVFRFFAAAVGTSCQVPCRKLFFLANSTSKKFSPLHRTNLSIASACFHSFYFSTLVSCVHNRCFNPRRPSYEAEIEVDGISVLYSGTGVGDSADRARERTASYERARMDPA